MNGESMTAYIGAGSNIGDRKGNLDNAINMLRETSGIRVTAVSSYIDTAPVGYKEQPDFLNAALEIETYLAAYDLLRICSGIERELKRERTVRWGPRTIDLDILLFGDIIMEDDLLVIPHPRMHEREFVLISMCEIAPDAIHPVLKKTVGELYDEAVSARRRGNT